MPELTVPLVGNITLRGVSPMSSVDKDQQLINCFVDKIDDSVSQSSTFYVFKRAGLAQLGSTVSSGEGGSAIFVSASSSNPVISAFNSGASDSQVFYSVGVHVNCGTISGRAINTITEATLSGETYFFIASTDNTGWVLPKTSISGSGTFAGDRTSGSPIVTNVSSVAGLYTGQLITATGFAVGTRILSVDSATQVTMTNNASSGAPTNTTFTRERISKIIDSNFSGVVGGFQELDGTVYGMNTSAEIRGSRINDPFTWPASNKIASSQTPARAVGLGKVGKEIVGLTTGSVDFFINGGTAFGSLLIRQMEKTLKIGAKPTAGTFVTYACCSDNLAFLGDSGGQSQIYLVSKDGIKNVATSILERAETNHMGGFVFWGGRLCIYVVFMLAVGDRYGFLYDISNGNWQRVAFANGDFYVMNSGISGDSLAVETVTAGTSPYSGKILRINPLSSSTFQDDTVAFTMTIQTQPYYLNDGDPFWIDEITLLADTQSSGSTTLTTSADDYATFGTVGSFDLTQQQKNLPCGGYYDSSVAFKLTDAGNNAWRGQALKIKWRPAA